MGLVLIILNPATRTSIIIWSPQLDLHQQSSVYKAEALLLCYTGTETGLKMNPVTYNITLY